MAKKKIRDRTELLFFQHPFRLEEDERVKNLRARLGFEGMGMFWEVYRRIRLGGGQYPLDSIILMAEGKAARVKKIQRLLTEFDLFLIDMGMVSMGSGLTVKSFKARHSVIDLQNQVDEIQERTYDDTLMPEELAAMDAQAKERLQTRIKENNQHALLDFV